MACAEYLSVDMAKDRVFMETDLCRDVIGFLDSRTIKFTDSPGGAKHEISCSAECACRQHPNANKIVYEEIWMFPSSGSTWALLTMGQGMLDPIESTWRCQDCTLATLAAQPEREWHKLLKRTRKAGNKS